MDDKIRELVRSVTNLREDVDDLYTRHERLRGKFYAIPKKPIQDAAHVDTDDATAPVDATSARARLTKSEILSRYFQPGRPTLHTGGK